MCEPAKTIVMLSGQGGELDRVEIPYNDATSEAIKDAVMTLVMRCSFAEGDRITVEAE